MANTAANRRALMPTRTGSQKAMPLVTESLNHARRQIDPGSLLRDIGCLFESLLHLVILEQASMIYRREKQNRTKIIVSTVWIIGLSEPALILAIKKAQKMQHQHRDHRKEKCSMIHSG